MFNVLKRLSLYSILIIVFLFIISFVSLTTSFISLQNSSKNTLYNANDIIATNYQNSLVLSFKFTTSPIDYGREYMSRYTIFNSQLSNFINLSALNNTSINKFVSSLNLFYVVNNVDRLTYEARLSELLNRQVLFTSYLGITKSVANVYLPIYFTVPITMEYSPGLDILSIPTYSFVIQTLLDSDVLNIVTSTRKDIFNQTLLDFGTRTKNGIAVVTVIIESIINEYISNNEKISLKKNNITFFNNCIDYCENFIYKDIALPNNEIIVASIYFNKIETDITLFLFVLLAILLFDSIILFIILNFEVQKSRFFLADKMLGYINHEIRNPLNCINGMIDVSIIQYEEDYLINDAIDNDILTDLTTAKMACHLLGYIINDIIDLKGMNDGKLVINKTEININEFFIDLQKILAIRIQEKHTISFIIKNPNNIKTIYFDRQRLFQITINFLTNAFKYTEFGSITLLIEKCNKTNDLEIGYECVKISVIDTGNGIDEKDYKNIFKPFDQNNLNKEKKDLSIGLGLYLCKMIIEQINGEIGFTSKINKGSTFYIEFKNEMV
jgi:signal transduction histidine kinase